MKHSKEALHCQQCAFFSCATELTSFSTVHPDRRLAGYSKLQMKLSYTLATSVMIRHADKKQKGLEPAVRIAVTQPKGMFCSWCQASTSAINSCLQFRLTWTKLLPWTWTITGWLHPPPHSCPLRFLVAQSHSPILCVWLLNPLLNLSVLQVKSAGKTEYAWEKTRLVEKKRKLHFFFFLPLRGEKNPFCYIYKWESQSQ